MFDILTRLCLVIKSFDEQKHPRHKRGEKGAGEFEAKNAPAETAPTIYNHIVDPKTTDMIDEAIRNKYPETPYGKTKNGFLTRDGKYRGFDTIHYKAVLDAVAALDSRKRRLLKARLERYRMMPDNTGVTNVDVDTALDSGIIRISGDRSDSPDPADNILTVDFRAGRPSPEQVEGIRGLLSFTGHVILERLNPDYFAGKTKMRYITTSNAGGYDTDPMHRRMNNSQIFGAFMNKWRGAEKVTKSFDEQKHPRNEHGEFAPVNKRQKGDKLFDAYIEAISYKPEHRTKKHMTDAEWRGRAYAKTRVEAVDALLPYIREQFPKLRGRVLSVFAGNQKDVSGLANRLDPLSIDMDTGEFHNKTFRPWIESRKPKP